MRKTPVLPAASHIRKRSLPLPKVYGLLETGPVLLLTTFHKGAANVMTMSWHTMLEFEPPLVGCVVSSGDFSYAALNATRQCVLNIPTVELASQVVGCGNSSGAKVEVCQVWVDEKRSQHGRRTVDR